MIPVASNVDFLPLFAAVMRQGMLWGYGGPEGVITLRSKTPKGLMANFPPMDMLPQARPHVFALMARFEGEELGEVLIHKVSPNTLIDLEPPEGFQLNVCVLSCSQGVLLGPTIMQAGQVWATVENVALTNSSAEDCYVLSCSIKPSGPYSYMPGLEDADISA